MSKLWYADMTLSLETTRSGNKKQLLFIAFHTY